MGTRLEADARAESRPGDAFHCVSLPGGERAYVAAGDARGWNPNESPASRPDPASWVALGRRLLGAPILGEGRRRRASIARVSSSSSSVAMGSSCAATHTNNVSRIRGSSRCSSIASSRATSSSSAPIPTFPTWRCGSGRGASSSRRARELRAPRLAPRLSGAQTQLSLRAAAARARGGRPRRRHQESGLLETDLLPIVLEAGARKSSGRSRSSSPRSAARASRSRAMPSFRRALPARRSMPRRSRAASRRAPLRIPSNRTERSRRGSIRRAVPGSRARALRRRRRSATPTSSRSSDGRRYVLVVIVGLLAGAQDQQKADATIRRISRVVGFHDRAAVGDAAAGREPPPPSGGGGARREEQARPGGG